MSTSSSLDMSVNQEDPLDYQSRIQRLYNERSTEDEAFNSIRQSFPSATRYEVAFWYARFKSGNTNLMEPIPSQADAWISKNLPEALLTNKTDNVEASEQGAPEVSTENSHVNTGKIYYFVKLLLSSEGATILTRVPGFENERKFLRGKRGVDDDSPYPFVSKAVRELKKIIEQPEVKIEKLDISVEDPETSEEESLFVPPSEATVKYFFEEIHKSVIGLEKLIDVRTFDTNISNVLLPSLISCLNPEILISLLVMPESPFNVQELITLPHWLRLDQVVVCTTGGDFLESLVHMNKVTLYGTTITPEKLANYKRKLLEQQHWFSHDFSLSNHSYIDCLEVMKPYEKRGVKEGEGQFQRQDGKLCLFQVTPESMSFKCIY